MKSAATLVGLLLTLLLGVGIAFIRPTQPVQVGMVAKPAFMTIGINGLDNDAIVADDSIQPARKCTFTRYWHNTPFHFNRQFSC